MCPYGGLIEDYLEKPGMAQPPPAWARIRPLGRLGDTRGRTAMSFGRRKNRTRVALGVVLAIGVAVAAGAQTPPGAATGELYTPAKDAKDLRSVLFNWMWH